MPTPGYDQDEDKNPRGQSREEPPLMIWALLGVVLVLAYILALLLLGPA